MKIQKHTKGVRKAKAQSVKELKVCFGKCRCFSAGKTKKR